MGSALIYPVNIRTIFRETKLNAQERKKMLGGVTIIPGVYIVVDTVNFLKISLLHIVGEYTKWPLQNLIPFGGRYIGIYMLDG